MDFRLDTYLAVCRYQNFTKAAEMLHITQPSVSQHIRCLEESYGVKLLTFEGKKMSLTKAGYLLYQAAVTMKHDERYLRENLSDLAKGKKRFIFGATLTIGEFVLAEPIKHYLELYPDAEVKMMIGNTSELLDSIRRGQIDFAIVEGNFAKKEYDYLVYSQERYIPVCGLDYSFGKNPEQLRDLLSERVIIREAGSGTREILEKNLEARNLGIGDFAHVVEIGGMNAIKSLVIAGSGITFLYEAAVRNELKSHALREIQLEDFQVSHDFAFIWNKGSAFSEDYRKIYDILKPVNNDKF